LGGRNCLRLPGVFGSGAAVLVMLLMGFHAVSFSLIDDPAVLV